MKWRIILSVAFLLIASAHVCGQIAVPQKVEVGDQIVASVTASMPDGATFDGGWSISCIDGTACTARYTDLRAENEIGIWAKPGKYELKFSGFWLLLKEVKFKDGEGNDVIIQSYIGHGFINESTAFEVTGGADPIPPNPPLPPTPGGPWKLVLFYDGDDLDNLPQGQQALLKSLKVRNDLKTLGHEVLEIVEANALAQSGSIPARIAPYVTAVKDDPLPRVAIAPKDGGTVLDFQLPNSYEALVALLNDPKLEEAMQ